MITYLKGDATNPQIEGRKIIAHICNDKGRWGRGFVLALARRYPLAKTAYMMWGEGKTISGSKSTDEFVLGKVQIHRTSFESPDIYVANMIAQHGINKVKGIPPIRYDALMVCLKEVFQFASMHGYSIHMPRIGCGLAGGEWSKIEAVINDANSMHNVNVFVYDWEQGGVEQVKWQP